MWRGATITAIERDKAVQSLSEVSLSDFKQALTEGSVRVLQIIFLALAAGILVFGFAIILLVSHRAPAVVDSSLLSIMNTMSILNIAFAAVAIAAGKFISDRQFSEANLAGAVTKSFRNKAGASLDLSPAQRCLAVIRIAFILRVALMEMAAYLGLAVTMMAAVNGIGAIEPAYFMNAATTLPVLAYILINFPTAEKIEEVFKAKIQKSA